MIKHPQFEMADGSLATLAFVLVFSVSGTFSQDPCIHYTSINDGTRAITNPYGYPGPTYPDYNSGWYRFTGSSGDKILYYEPKSSSYGCGSTMKGWMLGGHPTVKGQNFYRSFCFQQSYHCSYYSYIYVRKCNDYFVYWLHNVSKISMGSGDALRYCSSGEVDVNQNPCSSSGTLSDLSRSVRYDSTAGYTDDRSINGWYRFSGDAGNRMINYEPRWTSGHYRCSALASGWMVGKLPSSSLGKVKRKVCFSYAGNNCWFSTEIKLQNCGSHYVFWLKNFYYFRYFNYLRYCGTGKRVDTNPNPCVRHATLSDGQRSLRHIDSSVTNDHGINGWYRFTGMAGKGMAPYEPRLKAGVYHCKAQIQGWLYEKHPGVAEGKVNKKVCYGYGSDTCVYETEIKVQNCGAYYVYWLDDMYHYKFSDSMRHCGAGQRVDANSNPCVSHQTLSDESRSVRHIHSTFTNDHGKNGWYRFIGKAGKLMAFEPRLTAGTYRCKAQIQGWLYEKHPNVTQGKVDNKVCYGYGSDTCRYETDIKVQNCGEYYVYWLEDMYHYKFSDKMRHCGAGQRVDMNPNPCANYKTLSDISRSIRHIDSTFTNDHGVNGWYRFTGMAGKRMAPYEPRLKAGIYHCRAQIQGWLHGNHPAVAEGKVDNKVCYGYGSVTCRYETDIKVQNCGAYYVYWLEDMNHYKFSDKMRHCGAGQRVDTNTDPCANYSTLSDESRSLRHIDSAFTNDHGINGWYRFTGMAGKRMAPYEPRLRAGVFHCKGQIQGWLYEKHPNVTQGKVDNKVCYGYGSDTCRYETEIKVQNCGEYYVYWLEDMYHYIFSDKMRHCGGGQRVDTTLNPCQNHSVLTDESRSVLNVFNSFTNDIGKNRWYRFAEMAGEAMVGFEPRWHTRAYRCKANVLGWLQRKHPKVAEGKINKTACFSYGGDDCRYDTEISVQNCGSYYVYWLDDMYRYLFSDKMRYCGSGQYIDRNPDPCTNHSILLDQPRSVLLINDTYIDDHNVDGWYRFMGQAGNRMLDYDIDWNSGAYRCKAKAQGWMVGKRPRGSEGKVNRTVCFTHGGDNCWAHVPIKIRNCGDFFVYWLHNMYHFQYSQFLRYCGAGETEKNHPCTYYQFLTDETRINTYHDRLNRYCDGDVDGWYRYWGAAGHLMLNSCPAREDNRFPCGSYNQGWLNATNPYPIHGNVDRDVCFSHFFDCKCTYSRQIKMRDCGDFYVYRLEPVRNCKERYKSRYCGIKDVNAYQVTCSPNYMRIDIDRLYYNASKYASITLQNPSCGYTLSFDYISLGSIPSLCGSKKEETEKEIIYTHSVTLRAKFGDSLISRNHDETINFKCTYLRESFIDNGGSFSPVVRVEVNNTKEGLFSFNMNVFRTYTYEELVTSYPLKIKLRDKLYFEVNATIEDNSLALLIDNCYSTPTMDRNHHLKNQLITKGCQIDDTLEFIPSTGVRRRFSTQAFRYKNTTTVYIHCLVFLCSKASTDSRCYTGCYGNRLGRRRRRDVSSGNTFSAPQSQGPSGYYLLDTNQILLDQGDQTTPIEKDKESDKSKKPTIFGIDITTLAIGVIALGMLALLAAVVIVIRKRRGQSGDKDSITTEIGMVNEVQRIEEENDAAIEPVVVEKL